MEKLKCIYCDKVILEKEKQVQIITRNNGKIIGDDNFHWQCWINYFTECVKKKVEVIKNHAINLAGNTIKKLGGFLKT